MTKHSIPSAAGRRRGLAGLVVGAVALSTFAVVPPGFAKTTKVGAASGAKAPKSGSTRPMFPAISVTEIATSQIFDLAQLADTGGRPTLLWFWAPN